MEQALIKQLKDRNDRIIAAIIKIEAFEKAYVECE